MPTTRYFAKHTFTDGADTGVWRLVEWLTNGAGALNVGPGWDVIEAYDGTNRDTPSGGTALSNLPGTNGWSDGEGNNEITVDGAWIVLRSKDANNTNHFELYIERGSNTAIQFLLIPLDDFTTGGGAVSPPSFPSKAFGAGAGTLITFSITAGTNKWYGVSDEGMLALMVDTGGVNGMDWIYIGELDQPRIGGSTVDDRCYVIWDAPTTLWVPNAAQTFFNRLSPVDDSTILTLGRTVHIKNGGEQGSLYQQADADNGLGEESIATVGVTFFDVGHYGMSGFLRNVFEGGAWLSVRGTLDSMQFTHFRSFVTQATSLCFSWDGVTAVP